MHRFSPVAASSGHSLIARGLFIAVASPSVEHGFQDSWASAVAARGLSSSGSQVLASWLSSCGTWDYLLRGVGHLPGSGIEPLLTALAGAA